MVIPSVKHRAELVKRAVDRLSVLSDAESLELLLYIERLEATLEDFRDHGLQCDLNPTVYWSTTTQVYDRLASLLKWADSSVRSRAKMALEGPQPGGTTTPTLHCRTCTGQ